MTDKELTSITQQITKDGSSGFKAEKGRYHLYTCHGCPYAHRVTIMMTLKGLEDVISMDVVDYLLNSETGWRFSPEKEGCTKDTVNGKEYLKEVYLMSHPNYVGRITVPALFDKLTQKMVNNESAMIMRMLNSEFNEFSATKEQANLDFYPEDKRKEIDEVTAWIMPEIFHGVYHVADAVSQETYDSEVEKLFTSLDKVDKLLSKQRYLVGSQLSEADILLFVTLVRFDACYYSLWKCSKKMLIQYPNIWPYTRDIYQTGSIASTFDMVHNKGLYWGTVKEQNPSLIIPVGPELDFTEKHGRENIAGNGITSIQEQITKDGSNSFKAESGRYHLYVCHGCPFAHRVTIVRTLKGLEDVISLDVVDYILDSKTGWKFSPEKEGCTADTVNGKEYLKEIYLNYHPNYVGRITVPVLFDKQTQKIVNNESADILRMLNSEFNGFSATKEQANLDLYPEDKRKEIDEINTWIAPNINFAVYKVGSAKSQEEYKTVVDKLFHSLDKLDIILSEKQYLAGSQLTEADIRLFVTLVRFDAAYYSLYKCNKKMLVQYPNIWPYIRDIYQTGNIASTVHILHIKGLYWESAADRNPGLIVPVGPNLDFTEKHGRGKILVKGVTSIQQQVTKDGSSGFKAEKGRYHLYVSFGCPFAHRTLIARALKGLEDIISVDVVDYVKDRATGWRFTPEKDGCTVDSVNGKEFLKEVYLMSHPNYVGRTTVPVLFDKHTKKIVNNESAEILRMLNSEFNEFSATKEAAELDLYPENKRKEIDELNNWIAPDINGGVYACVFAKNQDVYNTAFQKLFDALDKVEGILSEGRFLTGSQITEADIRLFTSLLRFDTAYYPLFKCNKKMVIQYPNIWPYLRDVYQTRNVSSTINMQHIKLIYWTDKGWNPSEIIPNGPELDFMEKPDRE